MRITVANLKGGVGKTVSAVCVASLLHELAPTTLVDTDPQGSALVLADAAGLPFATQAPPAPYLRDLPHRLGSLAGGGADVVSDTPPGGMSIVRSALCGADTVLVPVK